MKPAPQSMLSQWEQVLQTGASSPTVDESPSELLISTHMNLVRRVQRLCFVRTV